MLKNYFDEKNVLYTEKLVDQDDSAKNEMMAASNGFLGVPFTVVKQDSGEVLTIIGFDKGKVHEVLHV